MYNGLTWAKTKFARQASENKF